MSLGLLGIITKVTLQCEPAFNLEETLEALSLDQCVEDLDLLAHSAQHVKLWTELFSGTCAVIRMNRTTKEIVKTDSMRMLDLKVDISLVNALVRITTYTVSLFLLQSY